MTVGDSVTGLLETMGALASSINIRRLLRDRCVHGVDWRVTVFFTLWGWWNCYFYPSLEQWCAFIGGIAMAVANTVWVLLAWRFQRRDQRAWTRTPALSSQPAAETEAITLWWPEPPGEPTSLFGSKEE